MFVVRTSVLKCFRKGSTDIAVLFIFLLAPSSPPVNVTAFAHNSTTISVAWLPVPKEHRNGKIISYWLIIYDDYNDSICDAYVEVNDGEEHKSQNFSKEHRNVTIFSYRPIIGGNHDYICGTDIEVHDGEEDKAENVTVTRLRKFTTYWVHVGASTSAGSSNGSVGIGVKTREDGE